MGFSPVRYVRVRDTRLFSGLEGNISVGGARQNRVRVNRSDFSGVSQLSIGKSLKVLFKSIITFRLT